MDKRTRAYKIYAAGKDKAPQEKFDNLLQAIAVMIDYATKKPTPKPKPKPELPISPREVFQILEENCSSQLALGAPSGQDFARLGRAISDIPGISEQRIRTLAVWIASGALSFWQSPPSLGHVSKHLSNWLSQAEAWSDEANRTEDFGKLIR